MTEGVNPGLPTASSSCFQTVKESKMTDALLVISCVALLIIGILASCGIFEFMGSAHAACLSYGMYAGAAVFALAEIVKLAVSCFQGQPELTETRDDTQREADRAQAAKLQESKDRVNAQIVEFTIYNRPVKSGVYICKFVFAEGPPAESEMKSEDIVSIVRSIDKKKIGVVKDGGFSFNNVSDFTTSYQVPNQVLSAEQILGNIRKPAQAPAAKSANDQIEKLHISNIRLPVRTPSSNGQFVDAFHCKVFFSQGGPIREVNLEPIEIKALIKAVAEFKIDVEILDYDSFTTDTIFSHFECYGKSDQTAEQILDRIRVAELQKPAKKSVLDT